jgi:hypothetical protein
LPKVAKKTALALAFLQYGVYIVSVIVLLKSPLDSQMAAAEC